MPVPYDAVLLVSFGGPEGLDDVVPFLENVTRGRGVPRERLLEVAEHYRAFGGVSPINAQNRALRAAIEAELRSSGLELPVYFGNRNWHPMLADEVARMKRDGIRRALAFATSAFGSYASCRLYSENLAAARAAVGEGAPELEKLRLFWDHPAFLDAVVDHAREALGAFDDAARQTAALWFSAHSIPESMARDAPYQAQLAAAGRIVADRLGFASFELLFQSRSGPAHVPWLGPDVLDRIDAAPAEGIRNVLLVPLGFVSDHLEVIWDLDRQAAERASARGMRLIRAKTVGTHPRFVQMVRELIEERVRGRPAARETSGAPSSAAFTCGATCCPAPAPAPAPAARRGAP